jgi:hypothetical protein
MFFYVIWYSLYLNSSAFNLLKKKITKSLTRPINPSVHFYKNSRLYLLLLNSFPSSPLLVISRASFLGSVAPKSASAQHFPTEKKQGLSSRDFTRRLGSLPRLLGRETAISHRLFVFPDR